MWRRSGSGVASRQADRPPSLLLSSCLAEGYPISRELFHYETHTAASVDRPTGRKYLDSASNGWSFYLFVRSDPDAAFTFLGPVTYESHEGDRPIEITWRLTHSMPAGLFERFATLAQH